MSINFFRLEIWNTFSVIFVSWIFLLKLKISKTFSQEEDGTYVTQVGEKATIDISFVVKNNGERAYEATLFIEYNSDELDIPILNKKNGPVNIDNFKGNLTIISLGNPMEPNKQVFLINWSTLPE